MKDQKRAYRRYKKEVNFKRRAKMYYNTWLGERHQSWGDFWEKIKSGERATWLKSTGNPCNCVMCSKYNKYIRPQKQYMLQEREYKHHGGWKGVWKDYKE